MRALALLAIAFMLVGCGSPLPLAIQAPAQLVADKSAQPAPQQANLQSGLNSIVLADLEAADADAKAHADTVASNCYDYLIQTKSAQPAGGSIHGLVSGFQQARDVDLFLRGSNVAFQVACGPLAMDVQNTILRGGAIGLGAATIFPVISGLPAAVAGAAGASAVVAGAAGSAGMVP